MDNLIEEWLENDLDDCMLLHESRSAIQLKAIIRKTVGVPKAEHVSKQRKICY